ncbi:hypothetical protein Dimus_023682 [Dionaea muscipula]
MDYNEQNHQIPNSKATLPADESPLDLYTIPLSSGWFAWDSIHDTERIALREFFDGSSFTRTPRIYKEYRDFIINRFREDPSRRLLFTDVRKALVGDVCLLRKVFNCLEKWGLINFSIAAEKQEEEEEDRKVVREYSGDLKVRVEEGAPTGVRVVAVPNSVKPLIPLPLPVVSGGGTGGGGGGAVDNGFKLPLASYSDVFGNPAKENGRELFCGNCKEKCESLKYYQSIKDNYVVCNKCFQNGTFEENKTLDDFKLHDPGENKGNEGAIWSETETLLLLESVLKHGDDWELVAQNVQTKTKQECISRLIELPFGELMLGPPANYSSKSTPNNLIAVEPQQVSSQAEEIVKIDDDGLLKKVDEKLNGQAKDQGPPLKKKRISLDPDRSLMKQVAIISTMVSPRVAASAADAAVLALCDGNPLVADIFYAEDEYLANQLMSGNLNSDLERPLQPDDSEMREAPSLSDIEGTAPVKDTIPLALRMRTGVATALGVAAGRARLLAYQEEREIEHLMATIIETQLKKLRSKIKHFEHLGSIMEKEQAQLEELKESIIAERIDILQKIFNGGIPRTPFPHRRAD